MSVAASVFVAQVVSTLAMFGVIWFVQLVHYPLFQQVGSDGFLRYAAQHATRTTWVVAPLMLVELATSAALLLPRYRPHVLPTSQAWLGIGLLVTVWASTALVQVPLHNQLQQRYSPQMARRLVRSNWIRTIAWTARAALVCTWLASSVQ